jgi:4-amino-4-deoxy-L-arabinose transferase-like glycosyltransferase
MGSIETPVATLAEEDSRPGVSKRPATGRISLLLGLLLFVVDLTLAISLMPQGPGPCPDPPGDSQDYDNLALNLLHGRGFGNYWSDPEWRRPYERCNRQGTFNGILERSGDFYPTAYRPPGFPILLAIIYALFGRSFLIARVVNAVLVAIAVVLAAELAKRYAGLIGWWVVAVMGTTDFALRYYANRFLSEPLAIFGAVVLAYCATRMFESADRHWAVASGVVLGALLLIRTAFVSLYMVPAALIIVASCSSAPRWRRYFLPGLVWMAVALVLPSPWFLRNCLMGGGLNPLGTQGGVGLAAGYHDEAVRARGSWSSHAFPQVWAEYLAEHPESKDVFNRLNPTQQEFFRSAVGQHAALNWVRANPDKLPLLFFDRVRTHWLRYFQLMDSVLFPILVLALLALWTRPTQPVSVALWAILAVNTLFVMMTYEDAGRLHVPYHLLVYILAGVGLQSLLVRHFDWNSRVVDSSRP